MTQRVPRRIASVREEKAGAGGHTMTDTIDRRMTDTTESRRLLIPQLGGLYDRLAPLAYPLVRISLGAILIPHGFDKLFRGAAAGTSRNFVNFGWSHALEWAYFIGVVEFVGGLLLVLGLFTRFAAAAFVIQMSVISFAILWPNWGWTQRGMEFAVFMGLIALAILFRGGGRYSLDRAIGREL